jgi:hypothetical protein
VSCRWEQGCFGRHLNQHCLALMNKPQHTASVHLQPHRHRAILHAGPSAWAAGVQAAPSAVKLQGGMRQGTERRGIMNNAISAAAAKKRARAAHRCHGVHLHHPTTGTGTGYQYTPTTHNKNT